MKKEIYLLPLLILTSCQTNKTSSFTSSSLKESSKVQIESSIISSTSSSSSILNEFEAYFETLTSGLIIESAINEENEKTQQINTTSAVIGLNENEFSIKVYYDNYNYTHEYFVKKENDDKVYGTRLGINNDYLYYPLYNGGSGEYFSWENDGYNNLFKYLTIDDFTQNGSVYELNKELLKDPKINNHISTLIYGNPGISFHSFKIDIEKEIITSNGYYGKDLLIDIEAKIKEKGNVTVPRKYYPFEEVEDQAFEKMILDLKTNNYTALIKEYEDDTLVKESTFYCNPDGVYIIWGEEEYGYVKSGEDKIKEVTYVNGEYKISSLPINEPITGYQPKFAISPACFNKKGNSYSLKPRVEGDKSAFCIVGEYASELDDFIITINEDNTYLFTNESFGEKVEVTFINIQNTKLPY